MTRLTLMRIQLIEWIQGCWRGGLSREIWVTIPVSHDFCPRVYLAWASNVRWIQIAESTEPEVLSVSAVVEIGDIFQVRLWNPVVEHC